MLNRLLVILAVVMQQVSLPALGGLPVPEECDATSCCRVIERVTCCGERIVESECSRTGGACVCAAESDQPEAPAPARPGVEASELMLAVLTRAAVPAVDRPDGAWALRASSQASKRRSHTAQQALLGVWRT